jgi:hypothetical protein
LCFGDQHPDVKDMLVKHRPVRARGGDRRSKDFKSNNVTFETVDAIERGNSRAYIEQRLSRDFPKIWKSSGSLPKRFT